MGFEKPLLRMAAYRECRRLAIVEKVNPCFSVFVVNCIERVYNRRIMLGILAGAAGTAAVFSAGYQSMSPTGQWYGRAFTGLPPGTKKLALTFDDGPNDPHTLRLLDVLAEHGTKATFFLIGRYVKQRPELARAIAEAGHAIGNHTFSHPNLIFSSLGRLRRELQQCQQAIFDATGTRPEWFRPPFGGRRPITLRVARGLNLEPVMWNVTGWDWKAKSSHYVERRISRKIRGGDVILLHDGSHAAFGADRSQTVLASAQIIARYQAEGYQFVTVPEMMTGTTPV
jgi:peptidoglycan/xylan/chitin deacetylase (PgdA/CDA1 family)